MKGLSRLGFIGVGAIAEALITGLCAGGEQRGNFLLSPRNARLSHGLAERFPFVKVAAENQAVVDGSDIVFLAVTPQVTDDVLRALKFRQDQRIVSLIATYDTERLRPLVAPVTSITRVAPIPSVARRLGPMILYPPTPEIVALLDGLGQLVQVQNESDLDALWAVTGIMAPYFGYLDAIASWLGRQNVPQSQARPFVAALFEALSVTAVDHAADGFDALRAAHTTPGGLNEQAYRELRAAGWMDLISRSLDLVQARMQGRAILEDHLPG